MNNWREDASRDLLAWHLRCSGSQIEDDRMGVAIHLFGNSSPGVRRYGVPIDLAPKEKARFHRFIAAVANNLVMTRGGRHLCIRATQDDFDGIVAELDRRFEQCYQMMRLWYPGEEPYVSSCSEHDSILSAAPSSTSATRLVSKGGYLLGIDIGNTRIKLALIREEELVSVYDWPNEIPGWIDRGPIKYMHDVMECVEAHLAGLGISSVEGVGVCVVWRCPGRSSSDVGVRHRCVESSAVD